MHPRLREFHRFESSPPREISAVFDLGRSKVEGVKDVLQEPTQGGRVANARAVQKGVQRLVSQSETGRVVASSASELKRRIGVEGMRTPCLQQALAELKHQNLVRGFSLRGDEVYIQG